MFLRGVVLLCSATQPAGVRGCCGLTAGPVSLQLAKVPGGPVPDVRGQDEGVLGAGPAFAAPLHGAGPPEEGLGAAAGGHLGGPRRNPVLRVPGENSRWVCFRAALLYVSLGIGAMLPGLPGTLREHSHLPLVTDRMGHIF